MESALIAGYIFGALIGLVLFFFVIRGAVLSALNAHAEHEREFARKVAAARAATATKLQN